MAEPVAADFSLRSDQQIADGRPSAKIDHGPRVVSNLQPPYRSQSRGIGASSIECRIVVRRGEGWPLGTLHTGDVSSQSGFIAPDVHTHMINPAHPAFPCITPVKKDEVANLQRFQIRLPVRIRCNQLTRTGPRHLIRPPRQHTRMFVQSQWYGSKRSWIRQMRSKSPHEPQMPGTI